MVTATHRKRENQCSETDITGTNLGDGTPVLVGGPRRPQHGGMRATARGLAGACHPMPPLAVTAFGTALAASAGLSFWRVIVLAAALLSGQLSVGWLNDYVDRHVDRAAERPDKPLARCRECSIWVRSCRRTAMTWC
jgi:hypothetical protein